MSLKFRDAETVLEEDDYREMNSVHELKETLEKETGKEISAKEAYEKASEEWWKLKREHVKPEETEKIPGETVEVAGTRFHVHGIPHDSTLRTYANTQRTSDRIQEYLVKQIDRWEDDEEPAYFEENLLPMVIVRGFEALEKDEYNHIKEIKDQTAFDEKVDLEIETEELSKTEYLKGRAKTALEQRLAGFLSKLAKKAESEENPHDPGLDRFTTLNMAMSHPKYLKDLQNSERAANLPLQLEYSHGLEHNQYRLFQAERSIYQANYAVAEALEETSSDAHIVVGASHQPQIADRLETLSKRQNIHEIKPKSDTSLEIE